MSMRAFKFFLIGAALAVSLQPRPASAAQDPETSGSLIRLQEPVFLSFEELQSLARSPRAPDEFQKKLKAFWETPIISNEAYFRGVRPAHLSLPEIGPFIRAATWNVEKSFHIPNLVKLLESPENLSLLVRRDKPLAPDKAALLLEQRNRLAESDIILLQEMDIGVKRSGYVDAPRLLAEALNMNYAYAAEQLEIDPVTLGLERIDFEEGGEDAEATSYYLADAARYKGAFGCAVLSRYPILSAQAFQLKQQPYDWYHAERAKPSFLEHARRKGTRLLFLNEITREVKIGGRIFFRVDLAVPELPGGVLSVINVHMEIKCLPEGRRAQMEEILSVIREIRNPVILAGDFNSAPTDISSTSLRRVAVRTAKNPTTWLSAGISLLAPNAMAINTSRGFSNLTKNLQDPTARDIRIVAPNPVRPLFDLIQNYRFADGSAFDFRGGKAQSWKGKAGTLSNSNQRDLKGFVTTFELRRPIAGIIGKYKLDWFFIKSNFLKSPAPDSGSYRFAPHFGEVLEDLNTSLEVQISDHHPMVVDLPLGEPSHEAVLKN
ncbi:MAG: hypothetical protein FGM27_05960 [Candidatus Omnitrophica bacterium]|nr:hypothetical protein [Candidatus Omnitrophota bacterium]